MFEVFGSPADVRNPYKAPPVTERKKREPSPSATMCRGRNQHGTTVARGLGILGPGPAGALAGLTDFVVEGRRPWRTLAVKRWQSTRMPMRGVDLLAPEDVPVELGMRQTSHVAGKTASGSAI